MKQRVIILIMYYMQLLDSIDMLHTFHQQLHQEKS